jgi:hypothetical protein
MYFYYRIKLKYDFVDIQTNKLHNVLINDESKAPN